jgi:hypothetical protein
MRPRPRGSWHSTQYTAFNLQSRHLSVISASNVHPRSRTERQWGRWMEKMSTSDERCLPRSYTPSPTTRMPTPQHTHTQVNTAATCLHISYWLHRSLYLIKDDVLLRDMSTFRAAARRPVPSMATSAIVPVLVLVAILLVDPPIHVVRS